MCHSCCNAGRPYLKNQRVTISPPNRTRPAPMAIFQNPDLILLSLTTIFIFISICIRRHKKTAIPTNWPLVGMLPALIHNCYRIHSFIVEVLTESGGTFELKGPRFCNMDMLVTCDPSNIHHIFSRNFCNYPKGPEFRKIFDILGDGIFNSDFELWELHRTTTKSFMSNDKFYSLLEKSVWRKVETGLLPVLDYFWKRESIVDLQDVFQRLTFDSICKLVLNYDPESLSLDLPYIPCEKAFNDAVEALLHRHILPASVWKLQKWLKIGKEKKLINAWKSFDEFIYGCFQKSDDESTLLAAFKNAYEEMNKSSSREDTKVFLRDTTLNLMLAGRDTTSTCLTWLFWLISKNPSAEIRIREEIKNELHAKQDKNQRGLTVEDTRKLVYLHGALYESLRLFPPVALEHKAPIRADILPTGNYLQPDSKVILSFYSTGRMENVWGEDCLEFRPERWISERGGIKHEPSFKFPAFNAGPRMCLGKEMAMVQMKMVAAAVLCRYSVEMVEEHHRILPSDSIIIQAKRGLKVRLLKTDF